MIPATPADSAATRPTILVVDDDDAVRDVVSQALTDEGYGVRQASDGLAALEALKTDGIQLVLTDVQMPRLGGLALAQLLLARVHPVPVVLMGAVAPHARPAAVPYIAKPFVLERLLRVIADVLARSGSQRGAWRRGERTRPAYGA
jgi:two-component system response regulator MprA